MDLQQELQALEKEINQLEEALSLIENPLKGEAHPNDNSFLSLLKTELVLTTEPEERGQKLAIAKRSLENLKRQYAQRKEEFTASLEQECKPIADEMQEAAEGVLAAQEAYHQALANFRNLAKKHTPTWEKLHPGSKLLEDLRSQYERGIFRFKDGKGVIVGQRKLDEEARSEMMSQMYKDMPRGANSVSQPQILNGWSNRI
ncbi:hypothetical protein H6F74_26635 [Trichocoleus sp. FACHB-90]|uniref:hypothetical protein n=1 Tax=Cyanophyceae TaxID=3028117 RepID=UPI00168517F6|nr:hypothetical protein [Trichocoleus sp. FACHB-90]MBD1929783.1 hypothetical protein [Trichocoleus sp. FACHB-90]